MVAVVGVTPSGSTARPRSAFMKADLPALNSPTTTSRNSSSRSASACLADAPRLPLALIFCSDLMFAVRLQNMARKTGYRVASARPATEIRSAAVLLVDIADRGDWETIIRQAGEAGIATIAFGPHMDTVG